jgi:hypothetical protein
VGIRRQRLRVITVLFAFAVTFVPGMLASAGTIRGSITGTNPGIRFNVIGDDGKQAGQLVVDSSHRYSIDLPPGRYRVMCASSAAGSTSAPSVYIFALDQPVTRNISLNCS